MTWFSWTVGIEVAEVMDIFLSQYLSIACTGSDNGGVNCTFVWEGRQS